jgi:hypothetical protein
MRVSSTGQDFCRCEADIGWNPFTRSNFYTGSEGLTD